MYLNIDVDERSSTMFTIGIEESKLL